MSGVKDLYTYDVPTDAAASLRSSTAIVASGENNPRIRIRHVDKKRFDEEAALLLSILNEAWADNWGFIPLTDAEIAYAGKKLKPIVLEDMILVAEYDGEPVAFMMALPDINEFIADLKGELFPFGWAKLLWRLRRMRPKGGRVPLMGVVTRLHATRLASQLAFMMIEYIRRAGNGHYGIGRAEVGWILDDNAPMISIAEAIEQPPQPHLPDLREGFVDGPPAACRPSRSRDRIFRVFRSAGRRVMLRPFGDQRRGATDEGDCNDGRGGGPAGAHRLRPARHRRRRNRQR